MHRKLVIKLIVILTILVVVAVLSFVWIRQQPVQLETGTEMCELKP